MKTFFAWHFTADEMRNGSPLPEVGVWEHYPNEIELCKLGLHWSRDPFDALQHAPGANLRRVEIKGDFLEQEDKGCSHYRRTVYQFDATDLLRYFSRTQALSVIHLYPNGTDDVVFNYLMTGDESLRDAARSAAESAARYAARSAAQSAAWSAARSAASLLQSQPLGPLQSLLHGLLRGLPRGLLRGLRGPLLGLLRIPLREKTSAN